MWPWAMFCPSCRSPPTRLSSSRRPWLPETDWGGPSVVLKSIALRLGVPWYAYDTLTLSGTVSAVTGDEVTVDVVGRDSLGDHITATVRLA